MESTKLLMPNMGGRTDGGSPLLQDYNLEGPLRLFALRKSQVEILISKDFTKFCDFDGTKCPTFSPKRNDQM